MSDSDYFKKPNASTPFTKDEAYDLAMCEEDPFYFIDKFMKVQHPTKGAVPLKLWEFQKRLVGAFHGFNKVVGLTARQMGKCVTSDTVVSVDGQKKEISELVSMNLRERAVTWLEAKLVELAARQP